MLQNLLKRRVLQKVQRSAESTVSVDDTEVILRKNKEAPGKHRQRITSCPDPARLEQLHLHNINMLDLRNIRDQSQHFLTDKQHQGNQPGDLFSTDSETDKENEETLDFFPENGCHCQTRDTADNDRSAISHPILFYFAF